MDAPLIWLIAGILLCVMEFTIPTAFTEFTLGVSAIIVAMVALVVPQVSIQIALWLVLSVVATVLLRRFMPAQTARELEDAKEAKTLTEILPGETGRVLYEGNSWPARSEDNQAIAPNQAVVVVGRQGNTLLVIPETLIQPRG
jgi:membrane protein implicated in regulation of membrane protease activity